MLLCQSGIDTEMKVTSLPPITSLWSADENDAHVKVDSFGPKLGQIGPKRENCWTF